MNNRELHILQICRLRGIAIVPFGRAVWLRGKGVDIKAASLDMITERELNDADHERWIGKSTGNNLRSDWVPNRFPVVV